MGFLSFDNIVNQQVETSVDQAVENHKIEMNPLTRKKKDAVWVKCSFHTAQSPNSHFEYLVFVLHH